VFKEICAALVISTTRRAWTKTSASIFIANMEVLAIKAQADVNAPPAALDPDVR
jgi:hypothetical protein